MLSVLIADDEKNIRDGLKCLLDWEALGFIVIDEAATGDEALEKIVKINPDIVLMDIRMPGLLGIEVIAQSQKCGYTGKFIIISGYSDFTYAKEAIHLGVESYITKPIDEDELEATLLRIKDELTKELEQKNSYKKYREKARNTILLDILQGNLVPDKKLCDDLGLISDCYSVVVYEKYIQDMENGGYNFSDLLRVTNQDNNTYEILSDGVKVIIILKGNFSLDRFNGFLSHYEEFPPQTGSPLDSIFLAYGRVVSSPRELSLSFDDVSTLISRRFFCLQGQHTLGPDELPKIDAKTAALSEDRLKEFAILLTDYIQSFNRNKMAETLYSLESYLFKVNSSTNDIKLALEDMFLQIKEKMNITYPESSIPFPTNAEIITLIEKKHYLYEIIQFFSEQFEMVMNATGNSTRDSLFDDIIYYINHNYTKNLKLESIAPLFGYNSAYLGKVFSKKIGENFNSYVDHVRINQSKRLLKEKNIKVYEVAEAVGYKNVDYFHKKFRKYEGISPAEFRKNAGISDQE